MTSGEPTSHVQQIQAAIQAHETWKTRLRVAIESGHSDAHVATVHRDDLCKLGRWLKGEAPALPGGEARLALVRQLHADFHLAAADVLRLAIRGARGDAEAAIESGEYHRRSQALIRELERWRDES